MITLTFDTCLDKMYVALGDDGKILSSKIVETTKEHYHSAFIISTIREVLSENNLTPSDINLIATNIGPGSFTGIRACVTVARVFAQGVDGDIKAVGVSSLEILSRINETEKPTLVALDARKEMAYIAIYDNKQEILAPQSILLEDLKDIFLKNRTSSGDYFVVTDDKLEPIIGGVSYQKASKDFGESLIQIASERKNGIDRETDWKKLLPLYIQPASLNLKKVVK